VAPAEPNGVKLELFIFDTFPHARRLVALQVPREEEFAPVKNAPGAAADSPDTARALFSALCRRRLEAAGATLAAADGACEVSPLLSYQGEGLEAAAGGEPLVPPVNLREPS
jgi:UDP-N-acetylglucosamine/UDP-N-acetylgalactosamine diphosphorylase